MRGVIRAGVFALVVGAVACASAPPSNDAPRTEGEALRAYLADENVGRAALEESLVSRTNGYATLRLARYTAEAWGSLPEYDPPTAPIRIDQPSAPAAADPTWSSHGPEGDTDDALLALGRRAFFEYPVQIVNQLPRALASEGHAGIAVDGDRYQAVWARTAGGVRAAYTCATCHSSVVDGRLVVGRNNPELDAAALAGDGVQGPAWPLGTVDVTTDGVDNPVAITDLRPMRFQKRLHHAATLRTGTVALAVRIETLIITSNGEAVRPPRRIAAALALFLESLGTDVPRDAIVTTPEEQAGASMFERTCSRCHAGNGASGEGVSLAEVGTDPRVGKSSERGTGAYRVPSLRHVGDRRRLFASGLVRDLDELLTPGRDAVGHPYGLDLSVAERASLLAYLRRL